MTMTRAAWAIALMSLLSACGVPGEMAFVRTQDADLPLHVQGNTAAKKMLLFVHGGPGGTGVTRLSSAAFKALAADVGVALYDQRMAGLSQGNATAASLTMAQHVKDLDLVVEVLKQQHPGTAIYLMGHSWGGALGTAYLADPARQAKIAGWMPTDAAYDMGTSLRQSREWAIQRAQERLAGGQDPATAQAALSWYQANPTITGATLVKHFGWLPKLGAYIHDDRTADKPDTGQLLFFSPYSATAEPLNLIQTFQSQPLDELATLDLSASLGAITLPSLVMSGRHDGAVPVAAAEACFRALGTPATAKTLTIFERSAHRPMDDEPQAFVEAVKAFMTRH
ncbi:Proline iminopeptidase [compost metagenome]